MKFCITLLLFVFLFACAKQATLENIQGNWFNEQTKEYLIITKDGKVKECYGLPDAPTVGEGPVVKGTQAIDPDTKRVVHAFSFKEENLVMDGDEFVKKDLPEDCKELLAY